MAAMFRLIVGGMFKNDYSILLKNNEIQRELIYKMDYDTRM